MDATAAVRAVEAPKGLLARLYAWIKRQFGRLNNIFRRRKSTNLDKSEADDTVTTSLVELVPEPTKAITLFPVPEQSIPEATPDVTAGLRRRSTTSSKKEEAPAAEAPATMEAAMEVRRASLPMSELTKMFSSKNNDESNTITSMGRNRRRASYAIGTRASSISSIDSYSSSGSGSSDTRRASFAVGAPSKKIEWVKESPTLLKKTEAGQKMTDGSLERSISRINEEPDPSLAWEKPEWAKEGKKNLRRSFHQLW